MVVGILGTIFLFFAAGLTTVINVVAGLGGGMVLFAALAAVLEYAVLIPLFGVTQSSGALTRTYLFRRHIRKRAIAMFTLTFMPFYVLGLFVWFDLVDRPEIQPMIKIGIALYLMIYLIASRFMRVATTSPDKAMLISGAITGFATTILGAVSPLMAPFFISLSLNKNEFVATWSTAAFIVSISKLPMFYFIWDRLEISHFTLLAILMIGSSIGAFVGKHYLGKISETLFRRLLLVFLSLIACKLFFWDGVRHLISV